MDIVYFLMFLLRHAKYILIVLQVADSILLHMIKLKKLWTQHIGKAATVDMAGIPEEFTFDEWYKILKNTGLNLKNSFKESNKNNLVAGHMQQSSSNIDLSYADEIRQAVEMLSYLEQQINKIAAIPEPRQVYNTLILT